MKKYYSPKDLINILGLSKNTVYKYLENDKIKSTRFWNGPYRVPAEELKRLINIYGQKDVIPPGNASRDKVSIEKAKENFGKNQAQEEIVEETVIEKIDNKVEELTEVSEIVEEKTQFPNLFDWFIGLSLIWLGLSLILTPTRMFNLEFLSIVQILPIVQMIFIALGCFQIILSLVVRRDNIIFRVIYLIEAVIFTKVTYDLVPGHNFLDILTYGSLVYVLFFSSIIPKTKAVVRFVLLSFLITGVGGILILILSGSALETLGLASYSKTLGFIWLLIPSSIFVLSLDSIKKKNNKFFYLSIANTIFFFGLSISRVSFSEWDLAMLFLLISVFSVLFPFRNKLELSSGNHLKKRFISYFAIATLTLGVGFFLIFSSQQLARVDAVKNLEVQTEEISWLLAEYLSESYKEVNSLSVNPVVQTAFENKDWSTVLSMTKNSHRSSDRYLRILSLDEQGIVTTFYPHSDDDLVGKNQASKEFFQQAKNNIINYSDLSLSTAVLNSEKKFLGVLSFSMNLDKIKRILQNVNIGKNGLAIVVDSEGKIISQPESGLSLTDLGEQFYFPDKQGNSVLMLSTSALVKDSQWQVVLLQPKSEVNQPIGGLVMLVIVLEVVVFLVGLWILLGYKKLDPPAQAKISN